MSDRKNHFLSGRRSKEAKIKAQNRRIAAARMGITPLELGMLTAARWKAEMTARPDETLQETEARAQEIWKKDKAEQEECNRLLSKAMKSITEAAESEETPPWVKENRGWTHEEAKEFKEKVAKIGRSKSKLADMAAVNLSGNGLLDKANEN